jgi:hypothetical protein
MVVMIHVQRLVRLLAADPALAGTHIKHRLEGRFADPIF